MEMSLVHLALAVKELTVFCCNANTKASDLISVYMIYIYIYIYIYKYLYSG